MPLTYPFLPTSNRQLIPGQFWAIPLPAGGYACGRVLAIDPDKRQHFYAGLMAWRNASLPTVENLAGATLLEQGRVSLRVLTANNQPLLGCRPFALDGHELPFTVEQSCWQPGAVVLQGYAVVRPSQPQEHPTQYRPKGEGDGYEEHHNPQALPLQETWGYRFLIRLAEKHFGQRKDETLPTGEH